MKNGRASQASVILNQSVFQESLSINSERQEEPVNQSILGVSKSLKRLISLKLTNVDKVKRKK